MPINFNKANAEFSKMVYLLHVNKVLNNKNLIPLSNIQIVKHERKTIFYQLIDLFTILARQSSPAPYQ